MLPTPTEGEDLLSDYRSLGLTLGRHPLALLRRRLDSVGMVSAQHLDMLEHGAWVRCCGLVLMRQRPGTAGGVTFVTLEDETGVINLIVWKSVAQRWRQPLLRARLLDAQGQLQRQGSVMHLIVRKLVDRTALLGRLALRSRDFH